MHRVKQVDNATVIHLFQEACGADAVRTDAPTLARYARTTGLSGTTPAAVLFPQSTQQVQQIVVAAAKHCMPLYPISRGKNWGYGDACAPAGDQVIVDLSRMNRIIEVNHDLAYAVIEAGVSQGQLYDYLRENRTGLRADSTGAGRDASLVGNTLDRGFGHTRYGDHFLCTCSMEIVLADGRVLNTGFGHYAGARASRVYRYGVGPFLDGLFVQSGFGIVTRIGLWLMPEPEDFCIFLLSTPREQDLSDLVDRLSRLRREGLLTSTVHIGNDLRVFSGRGSYPWQEAAGVTPLPPDLRLKLRARAGIGTWNVTGSFEGSAEVVRAMRHTMSRRMRGYRMLFLDDRRIARFERIGRWMRWTEWGRRLEDKLDLIRPLYGLLKGIPTDEPLRGAAWRVRGSVPAEPQDPLDLHAGLLWVSPIVPARGEDARTFVDLVTPIYHRHGFDALITLTLITERALCCVTNIAFDRREPAEVTAAGVCYGELKAALRSRGYISYRTGPEGFSHLAEGSAHFWDVVGQLKATLDPLGIISPGRYLPPARV